MGNAFDQFDAPEANPFDQFDQFDAKPEKSNPLRRLIADPAISLLKGAVSVPEAAVGLADLASGGQAGKLAEEAGFRPKEAKNFLDEYLSPQQQAANANLKQADGFVDTLGAVASNPSVVPHAVLESLPLMGAGGVVARTLPVGSAVLRGALGEGIAGMGSSAEGIRQESDDGLLTGKQALAAGASGAGVAAFGAAGGKLAQRMGIGDVDTLLAGGAQNIGKKGLLKSAASGALSEGVLEELPQSVWEQGAQNIALDRPLGEGVGQAAAMGLVTGAAMGAGGGAIGSIYAKSRQEKIAAEPQPEIAGLLPAPTLAGTPNDQMLQAAVARQNEVDAAQKNADEIYAERAAYEQAMQALYPGGATITADLVPLQQKIDDLLGIDQAKLKGLARVKYQKDLEKAFGEVVGITQDDNGREIPLTLGVLLDSQATAEQMAKQTLAVRHTEQQTAARLQQLADEEMQSQPDAIPVVGPLSAAANQAVQTGVSAQVQMQQAAEQVAQAQAKAPKNKQDQAADPGPLAAIAAPSANVLAQNAPDSVIPTAEQITAAQPAQTSGGSQTQPEPVAAAAPIRSYPKGQATMLAGRLTRQGFPSEAYPHPTIADAYAIRVAQGESNGPVAEQAVPQVAAQGTEGRRADAPGSADVSLPAPAGNTERTGDRAEVAASGVRQTVPAGTAGAQSAPLSKKPRKQIDAGLDSLFVAIAKAGGMDTDELLTNGFDQNDITYQGAARVGKKSGVLGKAPRRALSFGFALPLHKKGGMSFDAMREAMQKYGYLPEGATKNDAIDLFRRELGGERVLTPGAAESAAETDRAAYDAQMLAEQQRIDAERSAEDAAREETGYDEFSEAGQVLIDEFADLAFDENTGPQSGSDIAAGMRAMGFTEEEINNELAKTAETEGSGGQDVARGSEESGAGRAADRAQDEGARQGAEAEGLTGQSNEEAAAQFAQQEETAVSKEQADRERDAVPFSLAQQSQPKPQGVQGGMFTPDGRVSAEAIDAAAPKTLPERVAANQQKKADEQAARKAKFAETVAKRKAAKGAPTPNKSELSQELPIDGMQERSVRADESGSKEPAQSESGAGSKGNATDIQSAAQASALDAARKEQTRLNDHDIQEEVRNLSENGGVDLSALVKNAKYWDAENEEFTKAGLDEVDRLTSEKAMDNLRLPVLNDLSDVDSAHQFAQLEAMEKLLDGLKLGYQRNYSFSSSRYIMVNQGDGKQDIKLRFADHLNTARGQPSPDVNVAPGGDKFSDAVKIVLAIGQKENAANLSKPAEDGKPDRPYANSEDRDEAIYRMQVKARDAGIDYYDNTIKDAAQFGASEQEISDAIDQGEEALADLSNEVFKRANGRKQGFGPGNNDHLISSQPLSEHDQKVSSLLGRGLYELPEDHRASLLKLAKVRSVDAFEGMPASDRQKVVEQWLEQQDVSKKAEKPDTSAEPVQKTAEIEQIAPAIEAAKIEDFGEKLGGAKKDRAPSLEKSLSDNDLATLPLSKIWPADELGDIENKFAAAVAYAARNEIPAKPRVAYKIARWVEKVKVLRGLAAKMMNVGEDRARELLDRAMSSTGFKAKITLLEAIDRKNWGRIGEVDEHPAAYRYDENGKQIPAPSVYAYIDGKYNRFDGAKSIAEVADRINVALDGDVAVKKMQFEVRGKGDSFSIYKKGDKEYRKLKTFATAKEALAFVKDGYADLVAAWDGVKERDNVTKADIRNSENRPRTGKNWRDGKDVTDQQFEDAFGFRGVEFGLWVKQGGNAKDRQGMLNQAFDAMHDLAEIAGIPPKAISLNGTLGLGFGSRGSGAASAHFEPGNLVINLTKTRGAGTLAHEWFHALDNYFARMRNAGNEKTMAESGNSQDEYRRQNYVTYRPEPLYVHKTQRSAPKSKADLDRLRAANPNANYLKAENWQIDPNHPQGVRPEVESAFADLVNVLNESPMAKRARLIDKSPNGYWSRIIELGARSFENYVISKMMEGGYNNDYLANVREVQDFPRSKERYPYLLPEEVAPIAKAFDALFDTVETKETDKGVMLRNVSPKMAGESGLGQATITPTKSLPFIASMLAKENATQVTVKGGNVDVLNKVAGLFGKRIIFFRTVDGRRSENGNVGAQAGRTESDADATGKSNQLPNDGNVTNGFVNAGRPDLVFLNVDSANHLLYIVGHELGHSLKVDDPALWSAMGKELQPLIRRWSEYKANQAQQLDDAGMAEELFGDIIGQNFLNEAFWQDMAKENQSLFARIAHAAIRLLNKALKLIVGQDVSIYVSDMEQARAIIAKTMAKYAEGSAKGIYSRYAEGQRQNVRLNGDLKNGSVRGMADKDTVAGTQAPTSAGDAYKEAAKRITEIKEFQGLRTEFGQAIKEETVKAYADYVEYESRPSDENDPFALLFGSPLDREPVKSFDDWLIAVSNSRESRPKIPQVEQISGGSWTPDHVALISDVIQLREIIGYSANSIVFDLLPKSVRTNDVAHEDVGSYTMRDEFLDGALYEMRERERDKDGNDKGYSLESTSLSIDKEKNEYGKNTLRYRMIPFSVLAERFEKHPMQLLKHAAGSVEYINKNLEAQWWEWNQMVEGIADQQKRTAAAEFAKTPEGRRATFRIVKPNEPSASAGSDAIRYNKSAAGSGVDVRYNVTDDDAWSVSEPSKLDDVIYAVQDKHVDTKRVLQAIKATGQKIADQIDPYLQEELFHGRATKGVKDFIDFELRPLLKEMQDGGVDMGDFEEYLWNRHAPERNAQIARINPEMKDGGSGIKTAEARAYMANIPLERKKVLEQLAVRVESINRSSQKVLVESGLEKQETIDAWNGAYQHYVPLQREDVDSGHVGTGKGFSVRGSSSKRAMGSGRAVVDIIANITMQRERNIVRAEKNRVSNALMGLAVGNPNADFWTVDQAPKERVVEQKAIYTVTDAAGEATEFTRMSDAEKFARSLPEAGIEQTWGDRVTERVVPGFSTRDNVLLTRINGEDHYIIFNERDERAMRMAQSLKNLDMDNLGRVLSIVGKATRYLASINTQYNPVFGVINLIRDAQGALINLSSTPLAGQQKKVFGYTKDALIGIYQDIRAHRAGKKPASSWAGLFEEFQKEGGQTGYRDQYANAEQRAEAIRSELGQFKEGKARQLTRGVFGWLSDYNETMENAVRLAAYKTAKEQGMSRQQAASLAKNITVNFNRRGQMATQVGALYAFFNASVQGSARLAETLFETNNGDLKSARLSKVGKKIIAGGILLGTMQALLLAAAGFDDDEPPDFVRERNLILPIGGGKYLTLAMPLGFHVLPGIGRIATEFVLSGGKDPLKRIAAFASMFAESFNPIGSSGFSLQTITPSVVDPFAALAENRDFTGKEIYREDFNKLAPKPGHERAKDVATFYSRWISEGLNFITGGTEFKPGMLSWSPDGIDYLIGQALGGVGREANKVFQTGRAATTGEDLPLYKVPLAGRFVGDTEGQSGQSAKFYEAIKRINMHEAEYKGLLKDGRRQEAAEYFAENPAVKLVMAGNHAELTLRKLRSQKRDLVEKDAGTDQVWAIDERITATMKAFNERAAIAF